MATPEQLVEARKKAVKSPKVGKRGKGKKTVEKELKEDMARDYFIKEVMKELKSLTKQELKEALKDYKVRHYVFDQLMGRAKDKAEFEHTIPQSLIDLYKQIRDGKSDSPPKD